MTAARFTLMAGAFAATLLLPALAHARADAKPAPAATKPVEAAPLNAVFLCRTESETCHLGIVVGSKVAILFSNATDARGIEEKPLDVVDPSGTRLDLTANSGRVIMLSGDYDPKVGITQAEIIEVASPLVSFVIKAQLANQQDEATATPSAAAPAPAAAPRAAPKATPKANATAR